MLAMPATNMAAMKTVVSCTEKTGAIYEEIANLVRRGLWQVTIVTRKAGKVMRRKHAAERARTIALG